MFNVKIKKDDKETEYFVYDTNEVVQTVGYSSKSFITINSDIEEITESVPFENGLMHIIKNPVPVIINKEELEEYIDNFIEALNPYGLNKEVGRIPVIPITKTDYEMLKTLSEYQKDDEEVKIKDEINDDIKSARQYVRTKINPNQGYRTF